MSECCHGDTYELPELWPTGQSIVVCNCCGMSMAHWEQGASDWQDVDLHEGRRILKRSAQAKAWLDLLDTAESGIHVTPSRGHSVATCRYWSAL